MTSTSSPVDVFTSHVLHFFSDHFPVVMNFDTISIASFNVLNQAYMKPTFMKEQGLDGSFLTAMTEEDRTTAIVTLVMSMLKDHAISIVALQEVSQNLLARLLVEAHGYVVIPAPNMKGDGVDYGVILLNPTKVGLCGPLKVESYPGKSMDKYIQQIKVYLKVSGSVFTFCNTHAKFGAIGSLIYTLKQIEGPILCCGDFNVGTNSRQKEMDIKPLQEEKEFKLWLTHAPHSHVDTEQKLNLLDHFYTRDLELKENPALLALLRKDLNFKSN